MEKLQVHHYDRTLKDTFQTVLTRFKQQQPPFSNIRNNIEQDLQQFTGNLPLQHALHLVSCGKAVDELNEVAVADLWDCCCFIHIPDDARKDAVHLLAEQMIDIVLSGPCAQGQSTRLLQWLQMFLQ